MRFILEFNKERRHLSRIKSSPISQLFISGDMVDFSKTGYIYIHHKISFIKKLNNKAKTVVQYVLYPIM